MKSSHSVSVILPLDQLVADAMEQLRQLGYSRRTLGRYRAVWERLIDFSRREGMGDSLSTGLALRFLMACHEHDSGAPNPTGGWQRHAVNCVGVLREYAQNGRIRHRRRNGKVSHVTPAMAKLLRDYTAYCIDKLYLRPTTMNARIRSLRAFLVFLCQRNMEKVGELRAADLSDYLSSQSHLRPRTIARVIEELRSFLRFLAMRGILHRDLGLDLPKIRIPQDATIPSVWEPELIEKLLQVIDRSSPKGKRDYAILLLACRLGLRAADIRNLELDHINWDESRIDINQSKTMAALSVPLTEEVGKALIDYLQSGRPQVTERKIFLKLHAPFEPFAANNNLHDIVSYWRQLAGISFLSPQRRGLHSLRHSLATRLLRDGISLVTISGIMGHASLESTRIYAKADLEGLRGVSLDIGGLNDGV